ncbi:hypothetical protein ONS95_010054 [Cadophora gregata]|uniref:uncharacterized protein n=1 Tax=Cadophora gregata TaxID=51156 RepID=UPI0026DBD08D|nr:uncharacterized protein ONS95_010054 [Cadophora gregata]KAK0121768.1 hypothetical protein ONS95_010054 [Cadophora gregata]
MTPPTAGFCFRTSVSFPALSLAHLEPHFSIKGNIQKHQKSSQHYPERLTMEPATSFHSFKNLPNEIKHQIWTYTYEQEARDNARIQRIAKDPLHEVKSLSKPLELRIVAQKRYRVPSLLHACRDARTVALNYWSLWHCAEPLTFHDDGTSIYVSKEHDTFYFADGAPKDFWMLSSFVGYTQDIADLGEDDPKNVERIWREWAQDINHFAVDWWCWLVATTSCDWTWMGGLGLSEEGDLTIVIKNPNDPGHIPEFSPYIETRLKEVTLGTVRAKAVDTILTHIKYKEIKEEFPFDTQTVKLKKPADEDNCCVPALKALAVVGPNDDENSKEDEEYLEAVKLQARFHRVSHDIRNLHHERRTLAREIKKMEIRLPTTI